MSSLYFLKRDGMIYRTDEALAAEEVVTSAIDPPPTTFTVASVKGCANLLLGAALGVYCAVGRKLEKLFDVPGGAGDTVGAIAVDRLGRVWVTSNSGLRYYDGITLSDPTPFVSYASIYIYRGLLFASDAAQMTMTIHTIIETDRGPEVRPISEIESGQIVHNGNVPLPAGLWPTAMYAENERLLVGWTDRQQHDPADFKAYVVECDLPQVLQACRGARLTARVVTPELRGQLLGVTRAANGHIIASFDTDGEVRNITAGNVLNVPRGAKWVQRLRCGIN